MEKINWAIIIPTWREEHYIGKLLDSLINQTVKLEELIIVDAFSDDKTKAEVEKRQSTLKCLKFLQIPRLTISRQRNFGVSKTTAPNILFLDADVTLKDNDTLEKYVSEVERKHPDIALAQTLPDSSNWVDNVYYSIVFWYFFKLAKQIYPMATGMNLYVRRDSFVESGGFNEKVKVGEDHDLVQRMVQKSKKLIFLNEPKFITSIRRIKKEGKIGYIIKSIRLGFHVARHGFTEDSGVPYEFGEYDGLDSKK